MRRRMLVLGLATALLGLGCSDQKDQAPTGPSAGSIGPAAKTTGSPAPSTQAQYLDLVAQTTQIFLGGNVNAAQSKLSALLGLLDKGKTAQAQVQVYDLIGFTLDRFHTGHVQTTGGPAATQARVFTFVAGLYSFVGLTPPPGLTPGALGPDGAVALITPTTPDTDVVTGTKHGGIHVPTGSVTQNTLLTIAPLATPLVPLTGPLATTDHQYPLFYEFSVSPAAPPGVPDFVHPVTISICHLDAGDGPYAPADAATEKRLRIAHNIVDPTTSATEVQVLPLAPANFIDCSDFSSATLPPPPVIGAAGRVSPLRLGWNAVRRGLAPALEALLPAEAHASMYALCCLGGTTTKLSPFGAVDPGSGGTASALSATSQTGTAGRPAGVLPSVKVVNSSTGAPLPGVTVTFAGITAGEALTDSTPTTNSDGVATLGGWSLGPAPGVHQVRATVAGAAGSPFAFAADAGGTTLAAEDPSQEGTLTSLNSNVPTEIRFTNSWTQPIRIYWLSYTGTRDDGNGNLAPYAELAPGQSIVQATFVTHPWLVTNVSTVVVAVVPDQGLAIYQPTAEDPAGTPNEANFTGPWTPPTSFSRAATAGSMSAPAPRPGRGVIVRP